jgi:uroporphyrinogen-III synthase
VDGLQRLRPACRGPKPIAALKRFVLQPSVTTEKPHTSRELLQALTAGDLAHANVLLVHYGERNDAIADALRARGARVDQVCPYVWAMPENIAPVAKLVDETIAGRIDAVLFTSQIQARHFFQIAGEMSKADDLRSVLNADVVVATIGPVCADTLRQIGVTADVMPAAGNMASLVTAVANYFDLVKGTETVKETGTEAAETTDQQMEKRSNGEEKI